MKTKEEVGATLIFPAGMSALQSTLTRETQIPTTQILSELQQRIGYYLQPLTTDKQITSLTHRGLWLTEGGSLQKEINLSQELL